MNIKNNESQTSLFESQSVPPAECRRVVAIVGRPNVGKSAIFNRIAGKRIAIVHDESGVTRDRLMRPVTWGDEAFDLIDTGGVNLAAVDNKNAIDSGVVEQAKAALDDAAVAILVVDVQVGITPVDEEVARMVRKAGVPCLLAVNKCDLPRHESQVHDFAKLGFELFAVSAQHDRGFEKLMSRVIPFLPDIKEESVENPLKVAIVGRPNAGKSSYINRLLKQVRLIVSDVAGTTRDSIEVPFSIGKGDHVRHYKLIDTAGMRHVHRIDNAVERFSLFRSEKAIKEADVVVLVLDASVGPTIQDKHIAAIIAKERKSCVVLINKWDMAHDNPDSEVTETKYEPEFRKAMPFFYFCPIVFVSAKSGYNVRHSVDVIDEVAANTKVKLSTGLLNRAIIAAAERIQPPSSGRKHFKIFYATQTGTAPIRIRLFVNDAKIPGANYTSYLIRSLRESFGLEGVPIIIDYYNRAKKDKNAGKTSSESASVANSGDSEESPKKRRKISAKPHAAKGLPKHSGAMHTKPPTAKKSVPGKKGSSRKSPKRR